MVDESKKEAGRKGGLARKGVLSDKQRTDIAAKAALARWGAKATHKGNFKEEFGIDVECYVLDDAHKTAVISQRGMGAALGMGVGGGSRLPRLVNSKAMVDYVGPEMRGKLEKPLVFQAFTGGQTPPPSKAHGYDVTILIDVCKAITAAAADGKTINLAVVKQANIILSASAKAGIKGLVYALAGYNPTTQEVIQAFKAYVQEEAKKYEAEFPEELYMQWYRLYQIPIPARGRSWHFKHLTVRHIYYPLAKSNGKVLDLLRALRTRDGRGRKLFQFLNEVGARALRMQIGRVLEMAEDSVTKPEYERRIATRFGGQQELDLVVSPQPPSP